MEVIIRVLRQARRRLAWQSTATIAARGLVVLLTFVCLLILTEKLLFLGKPLVYAGIGAEVLTVLIVAFLAVRRRPRIGTAANAVDERFGLAERISSALAVHRNPSPMAQAVVADARAYARNVPVPEGFPMHLPRATWLVCALGAAALALLYFMPQFDLIGRREALRVAAAEKRLAQRRAQRMRNNFQRMKKRIPINPPSDLRFKLEKMDQAIDDLEKGRITRAEALSEFTKLDDALKHAQSRMAKQGLSPTQAKQQNFGKAQDLADALARKDFQQAAKALEELAKQMQQGKLNQQEKKQLQDALNKLCQGLGQAPGDQPGENPNQKLQQALRDMAAQINDMQLDPNQLARILKDGQLALQDMQDLQEMVKQMRAMCKACKGGQGGAINIPGAADVVAGIFNAGDGRQPGPGMGGPGIGKGGQAPVQPGNVGFNSEQLKGTLQSGRAVGSYFADGRQVKGEAVADFVEATAAARAAADEAIEQEQIPRAYQDLVNDYFTGMKEE